MRQAPLEWQKGTLESCPICGTEDLDVARVVSAFHGLRSAWVYKCSVCEQEIHVTEGVADDGTSLDGWKLLEPIARVLHRKNEPAAQGLDVLQTDLLLVNSELVAYLAKHPEFLRQISSRKFEELVAELLNRMGYEVELTPPTRDGGWDITAIWKGEVGTFLTLVECKRYRPDRPVGIEHIRHLIGVVDSRRASHGLIATTSAFTAGARDEEQNKYKWKLSLKDYNAIAEWLKVYS